ncbi:MAG TPA: hypothetical protein VIM47_07730 [Dermatophilaceae bacterium]
MTDFRAYQWKRRTRVAVDVWCPGRHGDWIGVARTLHLWADPARPDAFIVAKSGAPLVGPPMSAVELLHLEAVAAILDHRAPLVPA